jgi:hypothetical protein
MDFRRLGNILIALGLVVVAAAVAWWYTFFASVAREVSRVPGGNAQISVFDAKSCLYSNSDFCGLISGAARMLGNTPYEPMLFWAGLVGLVVGVVVRLAAKPANA